MIHLIKNSTKWFIALMMVCLVATGMSLVVSQPGVAQADGATITTDKPDYEPGETVNVSGSGFQPGETVRLSAQGDTNGTLLESEVVAENGGFSTTLELPLMYEQTYTLTATGAASGPVQTTFGDAVNNLSIQTPSAPVTLSPGGTQLYEALAKTGGGAGILGVPITWSVQGGSSVGSMFPLTSVTGANGVAASTLTVSATASAGFDWVLGTGGGKDAKQKFDIVIACTAPSITDQPDPATVTVGDPVTFSVTASGTATLSYQWHKGVGDVGTNSNSYTISPVALSDAGSYDVTVTNSCGSVTSDTAILTVNPPPNTAPVLAAIGNKTVDELATLNFAATATDAEAPPQTLTFTLDAGAPADASITSGGAFSWTPTEAQGPGGYSVTVRVTDSGSPALGDSETINIHVNEVNLPPDLTNPGNKTTPWDNALSFSLSASDPDLPANTLAYSISSGSQDGMDLVGRTGAFSWTPTKDQIGDHSVTFKVTDDGFPSMFDEETITITVTKRQTTLVNTGDFTGTYSDPVNLSATLTDSGTALGGKTVTLSVGTQSVSPVPTTNASGVALGSLTLTQGNAPSVNFVFNFAGDDWYVSSSDTDDFTISKEKAKTEYTGDNFVLTAGPTITTAPVQLSAQLTQEADGNLGDITLAEVCFELTPFSGGSPTVICDVPVAADGTAITTASIGVNESWTVKVKIESENAYWTADPVLASTLVVAVGTTDKRVTGGGWIADPQSSNGKGNFGFTVNYRKTGGPTGNSLYLFRGTDGFNYQVKSNSWVGGGLTFYPDVSKAMFVGKCNVQKIDPVTGASVSVGGNYKFTVYLYDGDLKSPRQPDKYGITILTDKGKVWRQLGTSTAPLQLGGGNVSVHSK